MSFEIFLVLSILFIALVLFLTGWVRMDIVALLVVGVLATTGLVSPQEALSGFSNPAVVTTWAMFILSAGLYQTGVARVIGRYMTKMAGESEVRMIVTIMLSSGALSAFMNNIGVAALMLPVVMDMARSKGVSPSRLLMPLAFGAMLGGLVTLIGTPPNLLISFALEDAGHKAFKLFDYTPIGVAVLLSGIAFIALVGRHFLPRRDALAEAGREHEKKITTSFAIQERAFMLSVGPASALAGKTLAESRLRAGLGLNVLSVIRGGTKLLDPGPDTILRVHDKLHVQGRIEALKAMKHWEVMLPQEMGMDAHKLLQNDLKIFEATLHEKSSLPGKRLQDTDFRKRLGINVLAVIKSTGTEFNMLHDRLIDKKDILLLQGPEDRLEVLKKEEQIANIKTVEADVLISKYKLQDIIFIMQVSDDAALFERAISESQIGSAFGLTVLGTFQQNSTLQPYFPGTEIHTGDRLLVKGNVEDLPLLQGLKELIILDETLPEIRSLESDEIQMAETVLAPRSLIAGRTLREINFRKKYGVTVLAIWREGRAHRTNIHNLPLRFGDSLLLYGRRDLLELMAEDADFIMLTEMVKQPRRTGKALTSVFIMVGILSSVILGLLPIAIAAVIGIALMVLSGCIRMEEAYRAIDWRAVFLIAGMLPMGIAMHQSGAATMIAGIVIDTLGQFGPWGIIAGLYLMTTIFTIAIQPAAMVVIMSPIALEAAANFNISPQTVMMAVAIPAAAVFISPVSHAVYLLVMSPGGYRFTDYVKVGLPLTLVVMAVSMLLLPIIWPL